MKKPQLYNPKLVSLVFVIVFSFTVTITRSQSSVTTDSVCHLDSFPAIKFKPGSIALSKSAKHILDSITPIVASPVCRIFIKAYVSKSSEEAQQVSWDKGYAVLNYLVETKGISYTHFIFAFGLAGNADEVSLEATTSDGPNIVPPPHPRSSKKKNINFREIYKRYNYNQ